eukprot:1158207-Pelagomonas_calceolata.AAC.7
MPLCGRIELFIKAQSKLPCSLSAAAPARLVASEKQVKNLEWESEVLQQRFAKVQAERDELYDKFESSIYEVAQKTGLKGTLLERRLEAMSEALEMKEAQLAEVLTAANLDPSTLQVGGCPEWVQSKIGRSFCGVCLQIKSVIKKDMLHVLQSAQHAHRLDNARHALSTRCVKPLSSARHVINTRLEEVLDNKNMMVKALQYDVAKVSKAHNDLINVYEAKVRFCQHFLPGLALTRSLSVLGNHAINSWNFVEGSLYDLKHDIALKSLPVLTRPSHKLPLKWRNQTPFSQQKVTQQQQWQPWILY